MECHGAARFIANPQVDLQRPGSLELLLPGGQAGFQLDARACTFMAAARNTTA